jgi:hypothetical protein
VDDKLPVENPVTDPVMDDAAQTQAARDVGTAPSDWPNGAKPEVKPSSGFGGKLIFWLAVAAPLIALFGAIGSGWGLWHFTNGLLAVAFSGLLAFAVVLLGLVMGRIAKKRGSTAPNFLRRLGMTIALLYGGWMLFSLSQAWSSPMIHDVSTDLADPPQFQSLVLRTDNWDKIPGSDDAEMKLLTPQQRWVAVHQKSYGDIRSVKISQPVVDVVTKAERLSKARGWDLALSLPAQGRLEATATTKLFRFKDDIVLRVRPTEDGKASIVDMRSVSRVGIGDMGTNAKRVREFLADLSGTVTAG